MFAEIGCDYFSDKETSWIGLAGWGSVSASEIFLEGFLSRLHSVRACASANLLLSIENDPDCSSISAGFAQPKANW